MKAIVAAGAGLVWLLGACAGAGSAQSQATSGGFAAVAARAPSAAPDNYGTAISGSTSAENSYTLEAGSGDEPVAPPAPAPAEPPAPSGQEQPSAAPGSTSQPRAKLEKQRLIYAAELTLAVYQVEQALGAVEKIAREFDGYLATRSDTQITIRVPRHHFEATLAKIAATGDVLHRSVTAEDVTEQFFDLEVRIKNARALRDRLQRLLDGAKISEALAIEKELRRLTVELEQLEGRLTVLRDRIAFSTITTIFSARSDAVNLRPRHLPFEWLTRLGLPNLLDLGEGN